MAELKHSWLKHMDYLDDVGETKNEQDKILGLNDLYDNDQLFENIAENAKIVELMYENMDKIMLLAKEENIDCG